MLYIGKQSEYYFIRMSQDHLHTHLTHMYSSGNIVPCPLGTEASYLSFVTQELLDN